MSKTFIGIDIGNQGAISVLRNGAVDEVYPIPLINLAGRKTSNRHMIIDILNDHNPDVVVIEEASKHLQSQLVATSMWFAFRGILDACEDANIRYVIVSAKQWQKEFGFKPGDKKAQSIAICKALFPTCSLKFKPKQRTENDNISDAILLAEYGRRKNY